VWSDIRCTRSEEEGEVLGREEIRERRYDCSCVAR
jgi:hypothetical protein